MADPVPTLAGDALVVEIGRRSLTFYAVGRVIADGQQDFLTEGRALYGNDRRQAMTRAKVLAVPGRRIYWLNIETGRWSEVIGLC
jgi:hypothetical protein